MRIILISFSAQGFALLRGVCEQAGHLPVACLHARSLRPGGPTRGGAGDVVGEIVDALPDGMDLLIPGRKNMLPHIIAGYRADLIVCYGFPWKLPPAALRSTNLGAINVHTSTLPKYRGPIPVNWAIRNGDKEIGVSIHWMESEFDSGGILAQETGIALSDDVVPRLLWEEVDRYIERLLPLALSRAEAGSPGTPQEEGAATYAGWMEPEFSRIDWSDTREEIHNQVRAIRFGSSGRSGPVAMVTDRRLRVLRTSLQPADGIEVMCGDGPVWITESASVPDSAS
ncbi:methionyl-tRNA formyltransferase [Streptomyces tagetis]|uniref:Methionyl-tRNA formyltransferase n=1 Tax=Streptomyces tagetis TaxID=2820809 RepID=A0A940XL86_9ACTN|nr:formyltransferase family protein [Streptomyces sp. RG38]MBQ0830581.1 methionyl-tRNA formyltransferase [Streptomyces sp. RG38]